jgi:hypothetical protein
VFVPASRAWVSAGRLMELRREERKADRGWQMISVVGKDW